MHKERQQWKQQSV